MKIKHIKCLKCGFEDEYESDKFQLSYYEIDGTCPNCGNDLKTKSIVKYKAVLK